MRKVVLCILLLPTVICAQVDTLDCLSYFPLHIGNKWVYEIVQLSGGQWDTSYQTISVIGDTIMSNGYRYFIYAYRYFKIIRIAIHPHDFEGYLKTDLEKILMSIGG